MNNLQKRILTSLVILPLSFFFIVKGGYFLIFFLIFVLLAGFKELFTAFKKRITILFLGIVLILSLFSIYYLRNDTFNNYILYWVIILVACSDIGGYTFGKIFKWKKLTKISPKKTISGVFGSFFLPLVWLIIASEIFSTSILNIKYFFLTLLLSFVTQLGDLTISYFKRIEKIKDTGKILPGHGGIFDRIDGLMFVLIVTFILFQFKIVP